MSLRGQSGHYQRSGKLLEGNPHTAKRSIQMCKCKRYRGLRCFVSRSFHDMLQDIQTIREPSFATDTESALLARFWRTQAGNILEKRVDGLNAR